MAMRRCLVLSVTAFLVLGMFRVALAQVGMAPPHSNQPRPTWSLNLWPFHKKKAPEPMPVLKGPVESAATRLAREKADYLRRSAVCLKLHDIANQTNDEELHRKADQLDQRAFAIYVNHSAQGSSASGLQADERILERRLGETGPTGQSLMPTQRASGSQASLKED
jgi:hypothetical protein